MKICRQSKLKLCFLIVMTFLFTIVVVNSNVLFALSFTNNKTLPGYNSCINLVADAIKKHAWPEAGLYYPQNIYLNLADKYSIKKEQADCLPLFLFLQ